MSQQANAIALDLVTDLQNLNLVDSIADSVTKAMGFEEDSLYWISMAIREGVINAMLHGNKLDASKRVTIKFEIAEDSLVVRIHDQGCGFDPASLPNPLDPENLLKPSGRGLFCIKSFMDEVGFDRRPDGMEIRMRKRLASK